MDIKYNVPLSHKEFEVAKKNPHCIQRLCPVRKIKEGHCKNNNCYNYTRPKSGVILDKSDDEINNDVINMCETLDDVRKLNVNNVRYLARGQRPSTTIHNGQLKLFLSTFQFLLLYTKKDEIVHLIYPGCAPGNNIPLLSNFFPNVLWYLYDPRDIYEEVLKLKNVVIAKKYFFTQDHISELNSIIPQNQTKLLISDIRVCDDETEETVERDMRLQERWVLELQPDYSQLKFRIPRLENVERSNEYKYLDGEIYLQLFARQATTETRLVVSKHSSMKTYNYREYEGDMYFFNRYIRCDLFEQEYPTNNIDGCHDCVSLTSMLKEYISIYNLDKTPQDLTIHIFDNVGNVKSRMKFSMLSLVNSLSHGKKAKPKKAPKGSILNLSMMNEE